MPKAKPTKKRRTSSNRSSSSKSSAKRSSSKSSSSRSKSSSSSRRRLVTQQSSPKFRKRLLRRKEIRRHRIKSKSSSRSKTKSSRSFRLKPHQGFLQDAVHPRTALGNLLLLHATGTGKTCAIIRVSENFIRDNPRTQVLYLAQSQATFARFRDELGRTGKCVHNKYAGKRLRKQIAGRVSKKRIRSKDTSSVKKKKSLFNRLRKSHSVRPTDHPVKKKQKARFQRYLGGQQRRAQQEFDKRIGANYTLMTYDTFVSRVNRRKITPKTYDLIFVDEIHNVRRKTEKQGWPNAEIYEFMRRVITQFKVPNPGRVLGVSSGGSSGSQGAVVDRYRAKNKGNLSVMADARRLVQAVPNVGNRRKLLANVDERINEVGSMTEKRYQAIMRIVRNSPGTRLLVLSATPMIDSHKEILDILYLLHRGRGMTPEEFIKNPAYHNRSLTGPDLSPAGRKAFQKLAGNYVTFLKGLPPKDFPRKVKPSSASRLSANTPVSVIKCVMSPFQAKVYTRAFNDKSIKKNDLTLTAISNFTQVPSRLDPRGSINLYTPNGRLKPRANLSQNYVRYSTKMGKIVNNLRHRGTHFVYSSWVQRPMSSGRRGGLPILRDILLSLKTPTGNPKYTMYNIPRNVRDQDKGSDKLLNTAEQIAEFIPSGKSHGSSSRSGSGASFRVSSSRVSSKSSRKSGSSSNRGSSSSSRSVRSRATSSGNNRSSSAVVAYIDGNTSVAVRDHVRKVFSSKANIHGDLIKVVLASHVFSESLDFKNVANMHLMEPSWNKATQDQILGRALRIGAARQRKRKSVRVWRYVSLLPGRSSIIPIDVVMYRKSTEKNRTIREYEHELQRAALDRPLFNAWNRLIQRASSESRVSSGPGLPPNVRSSRFSSVAARGNISLAKRRIQGIYKKGNTLKQGYTYNRLRSLTNAKGKKIPASHFALALQEMMERRSMFKVGTRRGYLDLIGRYYVFQPAGRSRSVGVTLSRSRSTKTRRTLGGRKRSKRKKTSPVSRGLAGKKRRTSSSSANRSKSTSRSSSSKSNRRGKK
jgi:hypothetical protein